MRTRSRVERSRGRTRAALILAGLACVAVWLSPGATPAQTSVTEKRGTAGTAEEAAWQAASWVATLPYGAAKLGVALVGGLAGGIGYVLSGGDLESSQRIWDSSLQGTYVLSPEHLRGERPVRFFVLPESSETERQP